MSKRGNEIAVGRIGGSRLLHALFADPWRKLVSILLGFALWHYLDDQISDEVTVDLTLIAAPTAASGSNENLLVVVDQSRYFVNGFYDRVTGEPSPRVRLELRGNRHLIESLNENQGFKLVPSLEKLTAERENVEFTIADVRAADQRFQPIIDGGKMTPASVRIELVKNAQHSLTIHPGLCTFIARDEIRSRLFEDRATFSKTSIRVLGPADQVNVLKEGSSRAFSVRLDNVTEDDTIARGTLRIVDSPETNKLRFGDSEDITVEVPLRVPWVRFRVEVPYLLDTAALPAEKQGQFRLAETSHEIEIEASADLETTLSVLNAENLAEFARTNFRLVVQLVAGEADFTDDDSQTPEFFIHGHVYEAGVDYRVNDLPPVRIKRIPPP